MIDADGATIPGISVRRTRDEELPRVMNVFDQALLDIDAETVGERIDADRVLVASEERVDGERIRGALVLSELGDDADSDPGSGIEAGTEIEAIAVRRRDRNRGIATALVERARRNTKEPLVAAFDARVRPFYASLGFDVRPIGDGRFRGRDTSE